jgi:hypothetical protein
MQCLLSAFFLRNQQRDISEEESDGTKLDILIAVAVTLLVVALVLGSRYLFHCVKRKR